MTDVRRQGGATKYRAICGSSSRLSRTPQSQGPLKAANTRSCGARTHCRTRVIRSSTSHNPLVSSGPEEASPCILIQIKESGVTRTSRTGGKYRGR